MYTDSLVFPSQFELSVLVQLSGVHGTGKSLVLYKEGLIDFEGGSSDKS
jgi:hypothetical protein